MDRSSALKIFVYRAMILGLLAVLSLWLTNALTGTRSTHTRHNTKHRSSITAMNSINEESDEDVLSDEEECSGEEECILTA